MTLYTELGGEGAIRMALDRFYEKVLADPQVAVFFDGVDVEAVKDQQQAFFAKALGGPDNYQGRDLRSAHERARAAGLDEERFEVFMGHFRQTLGDLGVDQPRIDQIMALTYQGKDDVLGA